jgi:hypothetical protein
MSGARCVPRRRVRANHRPARPIVAGNVSALGRSAIEAAATYTAASIPTLRPGPGGFDQGPAPVDRYGSPAGRPSWMAGQYLALREHQGVGVGVIYLLHFDRPIGDTANPRGFASHYTGWTLDLPARLAAHAAGRGARIMEVVGELGIGWQLARIWTGPRARERSLKQRGAPRRCPVCQLARLGLDTGRPADLFAFEVGPRAAGLEPPPELRP